MAVVSRLVRTALLLALGDSATHCSEGRGRGELWPYPVCFLFTQVVSPYELPVHG